MDARSLSRTEARIVLPLEAERRESISLEEIRRLSGASPGFARKLAHSLVQKGWLQPLRRGAYLLNPSQHGPDRLPDADPLRWGSMLVVPYYFGYATAAELHGLLPQAGRLYYVVTPVRLAARNFGTSRFRFVRAGADRLFGTETVRRRGRELVVSDLERTVLDCVDRPSLSGGIGGVAHILGRAKTRLRWDRLRRYLERCDNASLCQRTGYLLERIRPSVSPPRAWVRAVLPTPSSPYVPLAPARSHGRIGARDPRWHVIRNVADPELFSEGEFA